MGGIYASALEFVIFLVTELYCLVLPRQVLSKNVYVPDRDKEFIANRIAQISHGVLESADKGILENEEIDGIFMPGFRKGMAGVEAEELEALLSGNKIEHDDDQGEYEETDWDVEAVIDEDQL